MKKTLIVMSIFTCFPSVNAQWFTQNSGTNYSFNEVIFLDENTGFIVGNDEELYFAGKVLKTTNGGNNWILQYNDTTNRLRSIFFIDINTGWTVGYNNDSKGAVFKTTNGGSNWFAQITSNISEFYSVFFITSQTGWISGDDGTIKQTTNGGINWVSRDVGGDARFVSICFLDQFTGWVVGSNNQTQWFKIYKTFNGGINWINQDLGFGGGLHWSFRKIFFLNNNNGWIVGTDLSWGKVVRTTNGGSNWPIVFLYGINNTNFNSVFFVNQDTGWIVGGGINKDTIIIIKSTNGGQDEEWFIQLSGLNGILNSVDFIDQNTGWTVGTNGLILKTTNGGDPIGIKPISNNIPKEFCLYQNYPNPFNPKSVIKFDIPKHSMVNLVIYDVLGRWVFSALNEQQLNAGSYSIEIDAKNFSSGVYYYRLETIYFSESRKMVILK